MANASTAVTYTPRLLQAGIFYLDAGAMFGMIPRVVWSRWFPESGQFAIDAKNRMPLQQNSLLLESSDGKLVLIEAGIGEKMTPKEQGLYGQQTQPDGTPRAIHHALDEAGCDPRAIDAIVITHLHFDHAGGLTRFAGSSDKVVSTFPNAEIFVQRQEIDDALANKSTMHKTYLPSHLTPEIKERFRPVGAEAEILPGLTCFPTPGHTWGQQCARFTDPKGRTVAYISDVMPTKRHARPTTNMAYDVEPYTSMNVRTALLKQAHEGDWLLVLDHDPEHEAFRVVEEEGQLTLAPDQI